MKRTRFIAIVAILLAFVLAIPLAGCQRKVSVKTGVRVMCTYGHQVSSTVRTIEVPANKASEYGVSTKTVTCPRHQAAEKAYQQAQDDIGKSDLKSAAKQLAAVVAIDPNFKRAKAQLADIKAGKKPAADTSGGSSASSGTGGSSTGSGSNGGGSTSKATTPGDNGTPTGPVASLAAWVPGTIAGYSARPSVSDVFTISREYLPTSGSRDLVIQAEQLLNGSAASAALKSNVKLPYGRDGKAVKVNGRTGFIGSNGRDTAVLGIVDGPTLIVFQMRSGGAKPTAVYDKLLAIAQSLPR